MHEWVDDVHALHSSSFIGYCGHYKRKTGLRIDGCATFWKSDTFSCMDVCGAEYRRDGIKLLDRHNISLILLLEHRKSQQFALCVSNTHLLYNERRGDVKLAQIAIQFAEIKQTITRYLESHQDARIYGIMCGDYNLIPSSPLYQFIVKGKLDYHGMPRNLLTGQRRSSSTKQQLQYPLWPPSLKLSHGCQWEIPMDSKPQHASLLPTQLQGECSNDSQFSREVPEPLTHGFGLGSGYSHFGPNGEREYTTFIARGTQDTVDYIFYTPQPVTLNTRSELESLSHRQDLMLVKSRQRLLGRETLTSLGALPNTVMSSDHQMLNVQFGLWRNSVVPGNVTGPTAQRRYLHVHLKLCIRQLHVPVKIALRLVAKF